MMAISRTMMLAAMVAVAGCKAQAGQQAQVAQPPSPELVRYADWLAPKMQDSLTASANGGPVRPATDGGIRFRAEGGTVVMAFMADRMEHDAPSAEQLAQIQPGAAQQYCRAPEVASFVAKGGVFKIEVDAKDGSVQPIAAIDHCA